MFSANANSQPDSNEGYILVNSYTPGSIVSINGVVWGERTPLSGPIPVTPGNYIVTVSSAGHMSYSEDVEVFAGRTVVVKALLFPFSGALFVVSNVPGAEVHVGRLHVGQTPIAGFEIAAGDRVVRVDAPGYLSYTESLFVRPGERYDVSAMLVPDPSMQLPDEKEKPSRLSWVIDKWWIWASAVALISGAGSVLVLSGATDRSVEILDTSRLPGGEVEPENVMILD